jgi:hypothetical protein
MVTTNWAMPAACSRSTMRETMTCGARSGTSSFSTPAAVEQTQPSRGMRAARPDGRRQPRAMSTRRQLGIAEGRAVLHQLELGASAEIAATYGAAGIGCVSSRTFMRQEIAAVAKRCSGSAPGPRATPLGSSPRAQRGQLLAQEAAQQRHAAVAGAQVLGRMGGDRPLAHLRLVVAGEVAVFGLAQLPPELAVHLRAHPADVARLLHPPAT